MKDQYKVKRITTDDEITQDRVKQLNRVGLPIRTEVPVDEWLKGMGRGLKLVNLRDSRKPNRFLKFFKSKVLRK